MHPHLARDVRQYRVSVGEFRPERGVGQCLNHGGFYFNRFFLCHTPAYAAPLLFVQRPDGLASLRNFGGHDRVTLGHNHRMFEVHGWQAIRSHYRPIIIKNPGRIRPQIHHGLDRYGHSWS